MKTIVKIICGLFFLFCLKDCLGLFYIRMTHLSDDDLKWTECISKYTTVVFSSPTGKKSYLSLTGRFKANSSNPFYISSASSFYYEANSWYDYEIKDTNRNLEGAFGIIKKVGEDSLLFNSHLGALFTKDFISIYPSKLNIQGKFFDNCITFDLNNSYIPEAWSKKPDLQIESMLFLEIMVYYIIK